MTGGETPFTVLVADDHALFRDGVCSLIQRWPEFEVVGCAPDGEQAIRAARELQPHLVLMDVRMEPMGGVEATKAIKAHMPGTVVAMLTVSDLGHDLYEALRCGAHGFLSKNQSADDLHGALLSLMAGETVLSPTVAAKVLTEMTSPPYTSQAGTLGAPRLSVRERQLLGLLIEGLSNVEIGHAMHLSEGTVKKYLGTIMTKLHARNRVQVAVLGLRKGFVE